MLDSGIRTHISIKRAALDLRPRLRGHHFYLKKLEQFEDVLKNAVFSVLTQCVTVY